ncbi:AAA family ATPase [Anaerobium acetethylicum]|uniref:AAA domain-containing protein n=1 Tax=Anaerobium acetethylicum TaxID=1619234 RepID=A0A1D3TXR3_9FIRM|nr:AAA family ATPase [Anaerobium acetethylicum]SCP99163.1 AAA domain-containing protein [Anaerobium acetethylicum]
MTQNEVDEMLEKKTRMTAKNGKVVPSNEKTVEPLQFFSAQNLQNMNLQPVQFVVEDMLPHGLSIIASPPKAGKSWFVLNLCIAVAEGRNFLGHATSKCEVVYFALEDSPNRLNDRLKKIKGEAPFPKELLFTTECRSMTKGLEEQITSLIEERPGIKLIVFDTLQYIRSGSRSRNDNAYQADYNDMKAIKEIATKYDLCILLVHHSRKESNPNDPFANISGTYGINGAMDCMITMFKEDRSDRHTKMSICGRDVESNDIMLDFDKNTGTWHAAGTMEEYNELRAREQYNALPAAKIIRLLVHTGDGAWKGKVSDIIDASTHYKMPISDSVTKLGMNIRKLNVLLEKYDGITCTVINNGSGSKTYSYQQSISPTMQTIA